MKDKKIGAPTIYELLIKRKQWIEYMKQVERKKAEKPNNVAAVKLQFQM